MEQKKKLTKKAVKPKGLKSFVLKGDYLPKKKGDKIELNKEGEKIFKSKNLI